MPYLVARTSEGTRGGVWEVKWTWMPFFLASDRNLHKEIDRKMNEMLQSAETSDLTVENMSRVVIERILESYQIPGLKEALRAIERMDPRESSTQASESSKLTLVGDQE